MVYLAQLLVVVTDGLIIVGIYARNVPDRRRHVSRVSVAPGKQWCRVLDELGRRPLETQNKNLAIANRSRVSCAYNTPRAFIGLNITL